MSGRNGSGKSSFAEAIQVAFTGSTERGDKRAALWGEQWRNLHQRMPSGVRISMVAEDRGSIDIGVDWDDSATSVADGNSWWQVNGEKRSPGLAALGWTRALDLYRPMLSYDGLGGILESEPSRLFDALEGFLGLER